MKFRALGQYDRLTKNYTVFCPELSGCNSAGDTQAEALENIKKAIQLYPEPSSIRISGCRKVA